MSYDIRICVKVEGCNKYAVVGVPEYDSPTYNLRAMFVACMDWDYKTFEKDENGDYVLDENGYSKDVYYRCDEVLKKVNRGLTELYTRPRNYIQYEPENGWGTIWSAIKALESLRDCICEKAEEIPVECLWKRWT